MHVCEAEQQLVVGIETAGNEYQPSTFSSVRETIFISDE